jgi:hypothetical protein
MSETLEIDRETSEALDAIARARLQSKAEVLKAVVMAVRISDPVSRTRASDASLEERRRRFDAALARIRRLPVRDTRAHEDIIGYDENGLP